MLVEVEQVVGNGVQLVAVAASAGRHVQPLPGHRLFDDNMAGVGGDALDAVHRGRVAELDDLAHVGRRQDGAALVAALLDLEGVVGADADHRPDVAVLDPVASTSDGGSTVVAVGEDQIIDGGLGPVVQRDHRPRQVDPGARWRVGAGLGRTAP